jgi:hypothetical protein
MINMKFTPSETDEGALTMDKLQNCYLRGLEVTISYHVRLTFVTRL